MRLLPWVPGIGEHVQVLEVDTQIRRLEDVENFVEARALRTAALKRLPSWSLGPIWRSEGEDRLWRLSDYRGALDAFEKAIGAVDQSPSMYGVTAPERVFCGAAVAAVMVGDHVRGRRYFDKLTDLLSYLGRSPSLADHVDAYTEVRAWLERSLSESNRDA